MSRPPTIDSTEGLDRRLRLARALATANVPRLRVAGMRRLGALAEVAPERLKDEDVLDIFEDGIRDDSPAVRALAIHGLVVLDGLDKEMLPDLIAAIRTRHPYCKQNGAAAIGRLATDHPRAVAKYVDDVRRLLRTGAPGARANAARVLGMLGDGMLGESGDGRYVPRSAVRDLALAVAEAEIPRTRIHAADALCTLAKPGAYPSEVKSATKALLMGRGTGEGGTA